MTRKEKFEKYKELVMKCKKTVMENCGFDLKQGGFEDNLIDENRRVLVKCGIDSGLYIYYYDEGKEINELEEAENAKKIVVMRFTERLGEEFLDINFYIRDSGLIWDEETRNYKYHSACISYKLGNASCSVYDLSGQMIQYTTHPIVDFFGTDTGFDICNNIKAHKIMHIPVSEFTKSGLVDAICNAVRSVNDSYEWDAEIDDLLNVIRPALIVVSDDFNESWISHMQVMLDRHNRFIAQYDAEIEKLKQRRLDEVEECEYYQEIIDNLQNSQKGTGSSTKKG